jgi:hypothetical protein
MKMADIISLIGEAKIVLPIADGVVQTVVAFSLCISNECCQRFGHLLKSAGALGKTPLGQVLRWEHWRQGAGEDAVKDSLANRRLHTVRSADAIFMYESSPSSNKPSRPMRPFLPGASVEGHLKKSSETIGAFARRSHSYPVASRSARAGSCHTDFSGLANMRMAFFQLRISSSKYHLRQPIDDGPHALRVSCARSCGGRADRRLLLFLNAFAARDLTAALSALGKPTVSGTVELETFLHLFLKP